MKKNLTLIISILIWVLLSNVSLAAVWYIDGNVSSSGDGTSWAQAFKTIQEGVNTSASGDTVSVHPNTYIENINFNGKNITVKSTDGAEKTVIDGNKNDSVVKFVNGENATAVLDGFTITNGTGTLETPPEGVSGRTHGGGIWVYNGSSPTLKNLIITGNSGEHGGGIGTWTNSSPHIENVLLTNNNSWWCSLGCWHNSNPKLVNVTIADNNGCGLWIDGSHPEMTNSILWNNISDKEKEVIFYSSSNAITLSYSIIKDGINGIKSYGSSGVNPSDTVNWLSGNIDADPSFVNAATGDFHLKANSPAINSGTSTDAPSTDIEGNPRPFGSGYDMGAYEDSLCSAQSQIPEAECNALLALYDNTDGDNWTNKTGWKVTNRPCNWYGVICDGSHVTQLGLHKNQLTGKIPPELSHLVNSTHLYLYNNQLSEKIPSELGNLNHLIWLNLSNNQLSGAIPAELGNMNSLRRLSLYVNQLGETIPKELNNLTNLTSLLLHNNQLEGIPDLNNLTNLTSLRLENNQLRGIIPSLPASLTLTDLGYNALTDEEDSTPTTKDPDWGATQTVPPTNITATASSTDTVQVAWTPITYTGDGGYYRIKYATNSGGAYTVSGTTTNKSATSYDITGLTPGTTYYFVVETFTPKHGDQQNDLTSELSVEVSATTDDDSFSCTTQSEIPEAECDALVALYDNTDGANWTDNATNNWKVTNMPCSWTGVTCSAVPPIKVTGIVRYSKNLSGTIPNLSTLTNLQTLNLGNNQLSGTIPVELGNVDSLTSLGLNDNQLNGAIPNEFGNLVNLMVLELSHNQLSGTIPTTLGGNMVNLINLALSNNQLSEKIPDELGDIANLAYLALQKNQLTGTIPPSIGNLPSLKGLWLNDNQLSGTIPNLNDLTQLTDTRLGYNKLTDETANSATAKDPDWAATQTVPPTINLTDTAALSDNTVQVGWTPIAYTSDGGYYQVKYATTSGGPYTNASGTTTNKSATSYDVTGLTAGTKYYFVVETFTPKHGDQQNDLTSVLSTEVSVTLSGGTLCTAQTDIQQQNQCEALVALYNSTGGANWSDSATNNWMSTEISPCNWAGITCVNQQVTEIVRSNQNLKGSLPDLSALIGLQVLDLAGNNLNGEIPTLTTLKNLKELDLHSNQLTGAFPDLTGITQLKILNLNRNQLRGRIHSSITSLPKLDTVYLGHNLLTTDDQVVINFINNIAPDWRNTQLVPPDLDNVDNTKVSAETIEITWKPIPYQTNGGYYQVKYATQPRGPYQNANTTTADKTATRYVVTGLSPGTTYYFVVETHTNGLISDLSRELNATTRANLSADLSITQDSVEQVAVEADFKYTLSVENKGPDTATAVQITDDLPEGLIYNSANGTDWTCSESSRTLTCDLGVDLPRDEKAELIITVTAPATETTLTLTHKVTVSSATADPDARNNTASQETTVVTVVTNNPPEWPTLDNQSVIAGEILSLTLKATDPDVGDILTYHLNDPVPTGATIESKENTGLFTWTPSDTGATVPVEVTVKVEVRDNGTPSYSDTASFTITVNPPSPINQPPVFDELGNLSTTMTVGTPLNLTVKATDPEGDNLTFGLENPPSGANIDSTSGVFTWTPTGTSEITVSVTDSINPPVTGSFNVTVIEKKVDDDSGSDINQPPKLEAFEDKLTAKIGVELTFTVKASDSDGDKLFFSLVEPSRGERIESIDTTSANFIWTPTTVGDFSFTLKVRDRENETQALSDEQTFTISVSVTDDGPQAPVLTAIADQSVIQDQALKFTASATDPDSTQLTYSLETVLIGAKLNPTTGEFSWTPNVLGTYNNVRIKVTDESELSDETSFDIVVKPPEDVVLSITQTASTDWVAAGELLTYTLNVKNDSPNNATNVTVKNELPAEVTFVKAEGNGWDCHEATGTVTCTQPNLAAGATAEPITITVSVSSTAKEALSYSAKVSAVETDPEAVGTRTNITKIVIVGYSLDWGVSSTSKGTVTAQPDKPVYSPDDTVTLTATAQSCFEFSHWTGVCKGSGAESECTVPMDANKETTAHFQPQVANLQIKAEHGKVRIEPEQDQYHCGDEITLTATAHPGYVFIGWEPEASDDSDNRLVWVVEKDNDIRAIFEAVLTINPSTIQTTPGAVLHFQAKDSRTANYFWDATAGNIQIQNTANKATYTVPEEGVFYVWVTDGIDFAWALVEATQEDTSVGFIPPDMSGINDTLVLLHIAPETLNLSVDETQAISVRGYLADGNFIDLTSQAELQIEDSEIAQVKNGQVSAKSAGTTTLDARYQGREAAIPVNVQEKTYRLRVEPDIIILPEGQTQPIKVYEITPTGEETLFEKAEFKLCDLENAVALENCDAEIVSIDNGVVTGQKTGSTWLSIRAGKTVLSISVLVVHSLPLDITPAYATIERNEPVSFSVTGGEPPYQMTDDKGSIIETGEKENTFIYQYDKADTVVLRATDALNNTTQATVEIVRPLSVTPEQAVIERYGQVNLRASGGDGDYVWIATRGQVRKLSDDTVQYIAPKRAGLHTLTVIDGLGNSLEVLILVGKDLALSQQQLFLVPGETTQLRVLGGVHPYSVTATGGEVELGSGLIRYTAPQVAGHYSLNLKDADRHHVSAEITVALDLWITPVSGHLDIGETLRLHATGGFGKKRWGSSVGHLDKTEGETVIWTAPNKIGTAFIYVSDAAGTLKKATIEVASPGLAITPSIRNIHPKDTGDFTVTGGTAPYTWLAKQGEVPTDEQANTITYTAPLIKGIDELTVQDAAGKSAQAQINVYTKQLLASPKTLYIHSSETLKIAISGGTGDYTLWAGLGVLSESQLTLEGEVYKTIDYTAQKNYKGHDTIQVLDSAGNQGSIDVEITADLISAYAGPDGQIDEDGMNQAVSDFFAGKPWLNRYTLHWISELFLQFQIPDHYAPIVNQYGGDDGRIDEAEMNQALVDLFAGKLDETALYWIVERFKQDDVSQSD
ncbi:MAG: hypothetical protein DRR00_15010 [Candidatus Parabeggiatoa sp. nov. 3]|nr:MAG: hypothetical protein DRR00_15010 [Gammaproteobacteria bacterium]